MVASRYYNNPDIAQGFSNLSSMFTPPSGSELAAYASAKAKKEEAERFAQLLDYTKRPDFDREQFERMAIAAGRYNPNQSYYSVDQGNAVTMRGQDVNARTSLQMNEADNIASMARQKLVQENLSRDKVLDRQNEVTKTLLAPVGANETRFIPKTLADHYTLPEQQMGYDKVAADNAAAMDRQRLVQQNTSRDKALDRDNDLMKAILAPVSKDATRFVPSGVATRYGVDQRQMGVISAQPGEVNTLPDGRVIRGTPKPLSETEWQAQQNERVLQQGLITDQMLVDAITGKETPVTVMRPGANKPSFATPGEATRLGLEPFVNKGADAKPTNYRTPDGRQGTAVMGPSGKLIDTQTGADLPQGTVTFGTNVQGTAVDTGISTNANQTDATKREAEIKFSLSRLGAFRTLLQENPGIIGAPGAIRGFMQDLGATVSELAAAYGDGPIGSIQEAQRILQQLPVPDGYDPNIRRAQALALEMAYADAKASDPSGEVNVKEMERFLEKYTGGLGGNQAALAGLDELERSLSTRLSTQVETLRKPGRVEENPADPLEGQTATNPQTGAKLVRRNGKWEPVQ